MPTHTSLSTKRTYQKEQKYIQGLINKIKNLVEDRQS